MNMMNLFNSRRREHDRPTSPSQADHPQENSPSTRLSRRLGRSVTRNRWLLGATTLLAALLPRDAPVDGQSRVGEVAVETDAAGTEPFGSIKGIVIAPDERAWVLDRLASTVYLIDTAGDLGSTRGREGDGPGEFRNPCCLTLAADRLWVVSTDARRIDVLPTDDVGVPTRVRLRQHNVNERLDYRRPIVLRGGRSVMVTVTRDNRDYRRDITFAREYDLAGAVLRELVHPPVPDRYQDYGVVAHLPTRRGVMPLPWGMPFGAHYSVVRNSQGGWAAVFTSAYDVSVHSIDGLQAQRIVRSEVEGPPLTAEARRERDDQLDLLTKMAESGGGTISIEGVSDSRPPVDWITFDAEDRLWVALTPASGDEWAEAEVYSPDGALAFRAKWPVGIDLSHGAMRGAAAWGVRTGSLDEDWLVFLRFRAVDG